MRLTTGLSILAFTFIIPASAHAQDWQSHHGPIHTAKYRLADKVDRHLCGYGTTHRDVGCTGLRSELTFIFGSCWEFFEEPCNSLPKRPGPLHRWWNRRRYSPRSYCPDCSGNVIPAHEMKIR